MIRWLLMSMLSWAWLATANPPSSVKDEQQMVVIHLNESMQAQLSDLIVPSIKDISKKMPCLKSYAQVFVTQHPIALLVTSMCMETGTEVRNGVQLLQTADFRH
jgi:hypothetical protein